jgi:hypothetical protein
MGEVKSRWGFGLSFKGLSSLLMGDDLAEELEPLPPPKPAVRSRPRAHSPKRESDADSASATVKPPRMPHTLSPKTSSNNNKKIGDSLNSAMARRRSPSGVLPQAPFAPAHPPRSCPESQTADASVTLTQEQVNAKMKVVMNHPALWAEFKEKLGKHENANSHGTVRVVMQEFLQEHGDELEDETTLASSASRTSSLIFNVFAGLTGESSRRMGDEAVMSQMDTHYRTTRYLPSRSNSNSSSRARKPPSRTSSNRSSRSEGRPSLQKGGFASLSARAMNNLAGEEAPASPMIVTASDLLAKGERTTRHPPSRTKSNNSSRREGRPSLQKGGFASISARAMNSLAGEESPLSPMMSPIKGKRPSLQKGGFASLSARAMTNLAGEGAPARPTIVSDSDLPTKRERPGLQKGGFASLSARAMNKLAGEVATARPTIVSDSNQPTKRERPGLQKGGFASLSARAMNNLAGEEAPPRATIV